jgi:hypothetical protein
MAFLKGVLEVEVNDFNGAITRLDPYDVPRNNGLYALNVSYTPGNVATRYGHSTVFNQTDGAITALAGWVLYDGSGINNIVMYFVPSSGTVIGYIQVGAVSFTMMTAGAASAGAVLLAVGNRVYAVFYDSSGRIGTTYGQVFGKGIGADPLFAAPLSNVPTITETAAGVVTAGIHRVAYLPTTRNGFTTNLSPFTSGAFAPVSFTSTGGQNLHVVIPASIPTYMQGTNNVQIVMTTTTNLNRYFTVPGAIGSLSAGGATINVSIDDDDLAATGVDVTNQVNLLTNALETAPYNPPFKPYAIFAYSSRMCYCTFDSANVPVIYVSEQNDFQHLTADQHGIYLEGLVQPITGFSMRGTAYIGTQFSFYSMEDNGDVPVSWIPPQKVDGSIGILSPTCIAVNQAAGYAAIASERGLYIFHGGIFPTLPVSYYQSPDWARIDWTTPTKVQVVDDQLNKRFIVLATLLAGDDSSATSAAGTYRLTWDYTDGDTADTAKYSIAKFESYTPGAIATIQNISNSLTEVWYAPNASGYIIRQNDGSEANPYRDVATNGTPTAINSKYQTTLVPGDEDPTQTIHDFHGGHLRVTGNGNMAMLVAGLDAAVTTTPAASPLALSTTPGKELLVKWWLRSERASFTFGTFAQDEWFSMAHLNLYYTNAFPQR